MDPYERELVNYQKTSTELLAYSRLAGMAVTMSWPTHNGAPIIPKGFKNYLRTRGLFIECFLDLTEIYARSLLRSSYPGLPTLATNLEPDTKTLLVAFKLRRFPPEEIAPHFEGYLGEHRSDGYPAKTKQLSGPLLRHRPSNTNGKSIINPTAPRNLFLAASNRRRASSPYVRHQQTIPRSNPRYTEIDDLLPVRQVQTAPARTQNAIASSSRVTLESAPQRLCAAPFPLRFGSEEAEGKEAKYLKKLISGGGVSEDVWDGLFEKCTKCRRLFTASALKGHIKVCLGEIIILN
ncbi:hypothetical protein B0H19DRAFT_1071706 [Mycena capillaripes]|nr:hypothetical protein B0H19DRAFT_1071706 [Mycena capillaripes]